MKRVTSILVILWLCASASAAPVVKQTSSILPGGIARSTSRSGADQGADLLALVNQFRQANGQSALSRSPVLDRSAGAYAVILATQEEFSHGIGGTSPASRAQAVGYPSSFVGENIARGFFDPQTVETAWENSPGHRQNLLFPAYLEIGIGIAQGPFGTSWVQDFGRSTVPPVTPPPVVIQPPPPVVTQPPPPAPPAPVVSLVGRFNMYRDTAGNYFLLPAP